MFLSPLSSAKRTLAAFWSFQMPGSLDRSSKDDIFAGMPLASKRVLPRVYGGQELPDFIDGAFHEEGGIGIWEYGNMGIPEGYYSKIDILIKN